MSGWIQTSMGDLTELITKGTTPSEKDGGFSDSGVNYIKSDAISYEGKVDKSKFVYISHDVHEKFRRSQLKADDILFSMAGAFLGKTGMVTDDMLPANTNQAVAIIRVDKKKADPKFIHFFLRQSSIVDFVNNMSGQSAQPNINFQEIRSISLDLPSLEEQTSIASVLISLDNKIDLLHRQNKTLEAMAEALFRQWFVEGAGDWEEGALSDLCTVITKGTTPTTLGHQFTEIGVNFIKAESITDTGDFIKEKFAKISMETHEFLKRSVLQEGDVLCSIAGTIGRVAQVTINELPANTNQAIAILRVDASRCFPEFIYLFLKSPEFREIMDGKIVHAVQPNLSLGEIGSTTIKIPSTEYLNEFKKVVMPIFDKKRHNAKEISVVERLRDSLLPKLMSGEVRVA